MGFFGSALSAKRGGSLTLSDIREPTLTIAASVAGGV
jgi:hypothetical protein